MSQLRSIRLADKDDLQRFYADLSNDSRHARFLGCCAGLNRVAARRLCAPDGRREMGFVATAVVGGSPRVIGHVCLLADAPGTAEIAIAVADGSQHAGIGLALFRAAIEWAEMHQLDCLVATAFTDNWRVLRLLASSGHTTAVRDVGCGLSTVKIYLGDSAQLKRAA